MRVHSLPSAARVTCGGERRAARGGKWAAWRAEAHGLARGKQLRSLPGQCAWAQQPPPPHPARPSHSAARPASRATQARLRQRLHRVVGVHVAQDDAQAEAALQLADAVVDVLRFEQVVPAESAVPRGGTMEQWPGKGDATAACSHTATLAGQGSIVAMVQVAAPRGARTAG